MSVLGRCCEQHQPPWISRGMVSQTIFYDPEANERGVYGNCFQAAIASMLGRDLDAIPHFMAFGAAWRTALDLWAEENGLSVRYEAGSDVPPDDWCLLVGPSTRGAKHVVVASEGHIRWDPHPSREGLVSIEGAYHFDQSATNRFVVVCADGSWTQTCSDYDHADRQRVFWNIEMSDCTPHRIEQWTAAWLADEATERDDNRPQTTGGEDS